MSETNSKWTNRDLMHLGKAVPFCKECLEGIMETTHEPKERVLEFMKIWIQGEERRIANGK